MPDMTPGHLTDPAWCCSPAVLLLFSCCSPAVLLLGACQAHTRRKFHEALKTCQALAAGPLAAIQRIYQVEDTLRKARALPAERMRLRQEQAAPMLQILKTDLGTLRQNPVTLPQSPLGKAIDYTLRLWDRLTLYLGNGELEIDNNLIYAARGINQIMPRPDLCRVRKLKARISVVCHSIPYSHAA